MDKGVKVGRYTYWKSTRANKKLMTKIKEPNGKIKTIHFGNLNPPANEHYKDKTGIWSHLNHGNKARRDAYRKRHSGILKKDGTRAIDDYKQPAYHALKILW